MAGRHQSLRVSRLFAASGPAFLAVACALGQPAIQEVTGPDGALLISVAGVSDSGEVCGSIRVGSGSHVLLWTAAQGPEVLSPPAGSSSAQPRAISSDGRFVVGSHGGYPYRAFRWSREAGAHPLQSLPGGTIWDALDVALDGTAVGYSNQQPVKWAPDGTVTDLVGIPGATSAAAVGISDDGRSIVGTSDFSQISIARPFIIRSDGSGPQNVGAPPGGDATRAAALSGGGGSIVGLYRTGAGDLPFVWRGYCDGFVVTSPPAGYFSGRLTCVSRDGMVAAGWGYDQASDPRAILWDAARGVRDLGAYLTSLGVHMTDWSLTTVTGMSSDGSTLVGMGRRGTRTTAFLITGLECACPEPRCLADLNRDGNSDQFDIEWLINYIGGVMGDYCLDPDLNRDGNLDQDDVSFLIHIIAGGDCPF